MTVHSLGLGGGRKGFSEINPAIRGKYNRMTLRELKEEYTRLVHTNGRDDMRFQYVASNINLIQMARGVL